METKTCTLCKKEYPCNTDYFYRNYRKKGVKYIARCNTCHNQISMKWAKDNYLRKRKVEIEYKNTEKGYLIEMYNGIWNRLRKKEKSGLFSEERLMMYRPRVTKEDFFELWEKHKKEHGMKCLMTGVEMTHVRGKGIKNKTPTNISVDRLDNEKGYTKQNIIFVTHEFNLRKNAILIIDCVNILRQYKLRFPETNTCKIIELYESIGSLQTKEKYKEETQDFTKEKLS
jgi:hypothetical protein